MRKVVLAIGTSMLIGALTGCASATGMLYGDDRLAQLTAPQFGLTPNQITISNRQAMSNGSYYDVTLPSGERVRCFHDGNAMGLGMSNPPRCGSQINQNPLLGR
jgi:hypothetical protein